MALNSSKIVILTLLVIFLTACTENKTGIKSTYLPTQSVTGSPTVTNTPFPKPKKPTHTNIPIKTQVALESPTPTITRTPYPTNVSVLPNPDEYIWENIAEGFSRPTGIAIPMDGNNRIFILEQTGVIHIINREQILPTPFLDLQDRVSTKGSTVHGLLGMTFHPEYSKNGFFYLHYTLENGNSVISRFHVSSDPNLADPNSEMILLEISYPIGEHIGGGLDFGPDGYLYISIGDGGAGGNGDEAGNAQNPETYLGALLRLDVDTASDPQVWAIGLRNPWRFSFDKLTGDLFIADVGENKWEEINFLAANSPPGANFGWNYYEGPQPYKDTPPNNFEMILPVWTYDHSFGCSITGGYVYRGKSLSDWFGVYIYGDYCTGNIWGLLRNQDGTWENALLYTIPAYITSFGQDSEGEIYLASITGDIYKLEEK